MKAITIHLTYRNIVVALRLMVVFLFIFLVTNWWWLLIHGFPKFALLSCPLVATFVVKNYGHSLYAYISGVFIGQCKLLNKNITTTPLNKNNKKL